MTTNTDIAVPEPESRLIQPAGSIEEAVEAFQTYQSLRDKLGTPDDFQTIPARGGNRTFPKKSYVRKVQRYFGLSAELIKDEPVIVQDKLIGWTATVRAKHLPTGAYQDGDGSCGIEEKSRGDMQPTIHNLRSHAVTRAKNRAVMDLVGFGDVTADEMVRDEQAPADGRTATVEHKPSYKEQSEHGTCPEHNVAYRLSDKQKQFGYPPSHSIDGGGWCTMPDDTPAPPTRTPQHTEEPPEAPTGSNPSAEPDHGPLSEAEKYAMEGDAPTAWDPEGFMTWAIKQSPLFASPRDVLAVLKPAKWDNLNPNATWDGAEAMAVFTEAQAREVVEAYVARSEDLRC